jgi:hypothetical protein
MDEKTGLRPLLPQQPPMRRRSSMTVRRRRRVGVLAVGLVALCLLVLYRVHPLRSSSVPWSLAGWNVPVSPPARVADRLVPFEAHIMSKCPDARVSALGQANAEMVYADWSDGRIVYGIWSCPRCSAWLTR